MNRAGRRSALQEVRRAAKKMTSEADGTRPNVFRPAVHKDCGADGEVDPYWRIGNCFKCGVVPCGEMKW